MRRLTQLPRWRPRAEVGQDAAEYALILAFLVIVVLVGIMAFGSALAQTWAAIAGAMP